MVRAVSLGFVGQMTFYVVLSENAIEHLSLHVAEPAREQQAVQIVYLGCQRTGTTAEPFFSGPFAFYLRFWVLIGIARQKLYEIFRPLLPLLTDAYQGLAPGILSALGGVRGTAHRRPGGAAPLSAGRGPGGAGPFPKPPRLDYPAAFPGLGGDSDVGVSDVRGGPSAVGRTTLRAESRRAGAIRKRGGKAWPGPVDQRNRTGRQLTSGLRLPSHRGTSDTAGGTRGRLRDGYCSRGISK